jgi:hypothetical protein
MATQIIDWVTERLAMGYDAIWIYKEALRRLGLLGLSQNDYSHFERRIAQLTKVNE